MNTADTIKAARDLYNAGAHRLAGGLDTLGLLMDAAGGDAHLATETLIALDRSTPRPWTFSLYADGAVWDSENGDANGIAFRYNRSPAEMAAVFSKAWTHAARER